MGTRYTTLRVQAFTLPEQKSYFFTKLRVTFMNGNPLNDSPTHFSQVTGKVMAKTQEDDPNTSQPEGISITQVRCKVMRLRTPNFEWIEMFIDEVFPYDISYNSGATTMYSTDVAMVDSGFTQRSSRWAQPMMSYNIAYGVRTMEHLQGLIQFFRVMEGRKHAFRFFDRFDFSSTFAIAEDARSVPATSYDDQVLGVGDGSTTTFQLRKAYRAGNTTRWRPIYKPISGSVTVGLDGGQVTNWTIDYLTGIITFTTPYSITINDVVVTIPDSTHVTFTGSSGQFSGFSVGERIETGGFQDATNNSTSLQDVEITAIGGSGESITTTRPNDYGVAATNQDAVTIQKHPAPETGVDVTAGFQFHVPVRFDTDELPMDLEFYGIGSAQAVKLIEVRPSEANL